MEPLRSNDFIIAFIWSQMDYWYVLIEIGGKETEKAVWASLFQLKFWQLSCTTLFLPVALIQSISILVWKCIIYLQRQ